MGYMDQDHGLDVSGRCTRSDVYQDQEPLKENTMVPYSFPESSKWYFKRNVALLIETKKQKCVENLTWFAQN